MKRIILIAVVLLFVAGSASAWNGLGHRTVVEIAKRHLTDEAKANIAKYMPYDIVKEASWMDRNRLGSPWPYSNDWHSLYYDSKLRHDPNGKIAHGDLARALHLADHNLRMYRELTDSAVMYNLRAILHFVGDMHCPVHVAKQGARSGGKNPVYFKGQRFNSFHSFYDRTPMLIHGADTPHTLIADRIDIAKKSERKKICKGTIDDWINDAIRRTCIIHEWNPNDGTKELRDNTLELSTPLVNDQLRRAGYRLAHLLNIYFAE
ncbi:MAG: S1/P1 nuclease [Alistipes sp.]|nr:S1/P1 nuclease [Alistipes sp.]